MPISPQLDQQIRKRFEDLIEESKNLIEAMRQNDRQERERDFDTWARIALEQPGNTDAYHALVVKVVSLIQFITGNSTRGSDLTRQLQELRSHGSSDVQIIRGILRGIQDDYENGFLDDLSRRLEADVLADYMSLSEQLLGEGTTGQHDHVPAAVLAGAALEDALRRLCQRQQQPVDTMNEDGSPKKMIVLIDALKKVGVYNELKAKQLRAWADVRNAAAHGKFTEFNRQDVETMISGVNAFLADYL